MVGGQRRHGKQSRQPERSTETAAQTELVGQIVRQQPDEDDIETTTYKVGQPSDSREMVARRPRHGRAMAE